MKIINHIKLISKLNIYHASLIKKKVLVYKNSHVGLEKNYQITNTGILHLGITHPKNRYYESSLILRKNSKLIINGDFALYSGFRVSVNDGAVLELGSGYINYNTNIACFNKIKIGNNVVFSENVTIRDSDNHYLDYPDYQMSKPIEIGDNVWIGMNVTILKGVKVGNGAVIAAGSIVTRDVPRNCLVAGVPAKVIKKNIKWK
ncbi:acyltransferase [Priestia megaterium]|uniref:acyltransferase n=1 Tax=Priestia megaterium TaxID=1404 RepID=UPI002E1EC8C3|nr:acyltransferase [Priestia megaterium]